MKISLKQARRLALRSSLLDGRPEYPSTKTGLLKTIQHLGYVQIDSINIVERAHHTTLWSRLPGYQPKLLDRLQSKDRAVFEYWAHAMSYLPITDYRYYLHRIRSFNDPTDKWAKDRKEKCGHLMEPVLERIREEGPLGAKDFEAQQKRSGGNWWDWKPAKTALELLFWRGDLMITERRGIERIYDLTERVMPDSVDTTEPSSDETAEFFVRRALQSYGLATLPEIKEHIRASEPKLINEAVARLCESGDAVQVELESDKKPHFLLSEAVETLSKLKPRKPVMRFLSPFDNMIIQRQRIIKLFGFDYTIEFYLPVGKRKFGYYVLPILYGDRFVGRFDAKADRQANVLRVIKLQLEPGVTPDPELMEQLRASLADYTRFNNCDTWKIEKCAPVKLKWALKP